MRASEIEQTTVDVSSSSPVDWISTARFAALLGALIFIAFPHVILGSESFIFRDYGLFGYPVAYYHRECFWRSEIPLWNPYNNFGIPFLAQWNTMALYPPSLIYLLLPLPWSLSIFTLAHLFFGGVGMYKLAVRWTGMPIAAAVAGIAFAFNGFTLSCLMWPNHTASLAWTPWVILAVTVSWSEGGRQVLVAAFFGALQMLSGTPEIILFTWLIITALWLCTHVITVREAWTSGRRFAVIILLVTGLSAAQLVPFLDLIPHTHRGNEYEVGQWSFQIWGLANFFVPLFRNFRTESGVYFQPDQLLISSYYPGLATILLTVGALCWVKERRVRLLAILIVISVALAMGERAQLYTWLRKTFPQIGVMRYTIKLVTVLAVAWPLLAAFGMAVLFKNGARGITKRGYVIFGIAGVITFIVAAIITYARFVPAPQENWTATFQNGIFRLLFLGATTAVLWALQNAGSVKRQCILQSLLLVLIFGDLFKHVPSQNPTVEREVFTIKLSSLGQMNPRPMLGQSRALITINAHSAFQHTAISNLTVGYLGLRAGLYANVNLLEPIPKTDGFYALYLGPERDVHYRLFQGNDHARPPLARFLGISQVTSSTNVAAWVSNTNSMPLVTAGQMPEFHTRAATLVRIIASSFNPEKMLYLPLTAQHEITVTNTGGARVLSSRVSAHRIDAEVEAVTPSMVVFAQAYYHPWKAFVNGQPVKLWRANHAFQALQIPPGKHRIELVYRDAAFQVGAVVSLITLAGVGLAWVILSKLRHFSAGRAPAQTIEPSGDNLPAMANP